MDAAAGLQVFHVTWFSIVAALLVGMHCGLLNATAAVPRVQAMAMIRALTNSG